MVKVTAPYSAARCQRCGRRFEDLSYGWWEQNMNNGASPPIADCSECRGVIKPDIVFFGETVNGYEKAEQMVVECDLLLVLGSSLQVTPASHLPYSTQATTLVINQGPVALPPAPHRYFVDSDLDGYFRQVAVCLGRGG
ncbi:MAG: Sir2 family NAD-dependent protein deacetylase [Syntrophotaleaceae bacterium]